MDKAKLKERGVRDTEIYQAVLYGAAYDSLDYDEDVRRVSPRRPQGGSQRRNKEIVTVVRLGGEEKESGTPWPPRSGTDCSTASPTRAAAAAKLALTAGMGADEVQEIVVQVNTTKSGKRQEAIVDHFRSVFTQWIQQAGGATLRTAGRSLGVSPKTPWGPGPGEILLRVDLLEDGEWHFLEEVTNELKKIGSAGKAQRRNERDRAAFYRAREKPTLPWHKTLSEDRQIEPGQRAVIRDILKNDSFEVEPKQRPGRLPRRRSPDP